MQEIWKDITGYEGRYKVSNAGKVKSTKTVTLTSNAQERTYKGKTLSTSIGTTGYCVVNLRFDNKTKQFKVHRLVAEAFLGQSNLFVNHKDLNKTNNNLDNLEYVTNQQNITHAITNGIMTGKARLTTKERDTIRKLRAKGIKLKVLAKQFKMSESAISEVARGTTWRWENG